ncbi:hypothetical protein QYF36_008242 [Acer negundo]|nr:hypothetical protein QYF36_008242 [Acer negundo]
MNRVILQKEEHELGLLVVGRPWISEKEQRGAPNHFNKFMKGLRKEKDNLKMISKTGLRSQSVERLTIEGDLRFLFIDMTELEVRFAAEFLLMHFVATEVLTQVPVGVEFQGSSCVRKRRNE